MFQDEWLGKIAVGDGRYPLTNLIGETLLTAHRASGFCYPSVERGYGGLNIVMPVREAYKVFSCDEAWLVELDRNGDRPHRETDRRRSQTIHLDPLRELPNRLETGPKSLP